MDPLDIEAIKTELIGFLREHAGDQMSSHTIAKKLGRQGPSTRQFLVELAEHGLVRRSGQRSSVAFYLPTAAQIEAENRIIEDKFRPL
jgi:DNA-binding IclR family transcriptional regulator